MLVWRVEKNGVGPYRSYGDMGSDAYELLSMFTQDDRLNHPTPSEDGGMCEAWVSMHWTLHENYLFGFKDAGQLKDWFCREVRMALSRIGFKVSQYEVPAENALIGYYQVAYERDHALLMGQCELTEV